MELGPFARETGERKEKKMILSPGGIKEGVKNGGVTSSGAERRNVDVAKRVGLLWAESLGD